MPVGMSSSSSASFVGGGVDEDDEGGRMVMGEEEERESLERELSSLDGGAISIEVAVTQMQTMPTRNPEAEYKVRRL